ncbi:hypothetical protein PN498_03525 [Oscillatoria sp. CS-180]|uniref:hypothetical protein n=1 Tax=Oscillatoria sp. CS-180 TaxID=3021720 RepID=UPI00232C3046|nr:hypothetical protein [Oscillatoria sp. CS-180]MDB9525044.1 hypothetical protein [Oscillatoria sp. CS-180]
MSERLDYVKQLEAQITTTKTTLGKLKAERKAHLLAAQHEEIENLEKYLDEANISVKGLSEAADDAWTDLREALDRLMGDISSGLKKLMGDSENS